MANRTEIIDLLKRISSIYQHKIVEERKKYLNGDAFNLINVMKKQTDETCTHSRILADLLNPQGAHGQGSLFLELFLKQTYLSSFELDINKVKVSTELSIGGVDFHYRHGGRIDILISDGSHAIIIENKIWANDQEKQLVRYQRYAQDKFHEYLLIYLTLDGKEASESATNNQLTANKDYFCLSYARNITSWLEDCLQSLHDKPRLSDALQQYLDILFELTNQSMNTISQKQLLKLLTQKDNIPIIAYLLENGDEWLNELLNLHIWLPIEKWANEHDFIFEKGTNGCWIRKKEWLAYAIFLCTDNSKSWSNLYISIKEYTKIKKNQRILKKDRIQLDCFEGLTEMYCPFGYQLLPYEIRWWNYSTATRIANREVFNYFVTMVEQIMEAIKMNKIQGGF